MSKEKVDAILTSMAKVQQSLDAIKKDQQGYGYKFRGIDQVLNTLNPLFKENHIVTLRRNVKSNRVVREVTTTKDMLQVVTDENGLPIKDEKGKDVKTMQPKTTTKQYVEVMMEAEYVFKSLIDGSEIVTEGFGEGQDTSGGDKASSMATSNAYKYVIFEMFNIATDEQKDSDQVTASANKNKQEKTSFSGRGKSNSEKPKEAAKEEPKSEDKPADTEKPKRSFRRE